jgi:hypothetical protein
MLLSVIINIIILKVPIVPVLQLMIVTVLFNLGATSNTSNFKQFNFEVICLFYSMYMHLVHISILRLTIIIIEV